MQKQTLLLSSLLPCVWLLSACIAPTTTNNDTTAPAPATTAANSDTGNSDTGNSAAFPVTVVDVIGHELTLEGPPAFFVCTVNSCVSNMAFIGVMPDAVTAYQVLGSHPAYFGSAFDTVVRIPMAESLPNLEELLVLQPDLVVGGEELYTAISDHVSTYEQNYDTATLDRFFYDARNYARMFGLEEQTEARISALLERAKAYGIASGREKSIYFGSMQDEEGQLWSVNGGATSCGFVQPPGQCTEEFQDEWQEVSFEWLLAINPDVLIIEDHGLEFGEKTRAALERLKDNPLWQQLISVQNNQVHLLERAISRPGDPLVFELWLDTVMPLAYPEIFDGSLTDEEVQALLAEQ